ncbi:MAG: hypothetical protein AB7O96_18915 [Pseudobdellovibrionaceae bacterium]
MKLQGNPEYKFLVVTAALVVTMGFHTFYAITQPINVAVAAEPEAFIKSSRSPASLVAAVTVSEKTVLTSQVLEWECGQKLAPIAVTSSQLRIKGKNRKSLCNLTGIKNSTNGFTASVFQTSKEAFTTDFINLVEGNNKIQITSRDESGKVISYELQVHKN